MKRYQNLALEKSIREAGKAILSHYQKTSFTKTKEDNSPLTLADSDSNQILIDCLKSIEPQLPIISEETAITPFDERKNWTRFWMIDPLDGTKEFLAAIPEFTVNIALIENGAPVLGYVLNPITQILYVGEKTCGSFKVDIEGTETRLISKVPAKDRIAVVSRSHKAEVPEDFKLKNNITKIISLGSSLKITSLAENTAHIYPRFSPIHEWDVAAGDAVFRYSGEKNPRHSPYKYNTASLTFENFIIGNDLET